MTTRHDSIQAYIMYSIHFLPLAILIKAKPMEHLIVTKVKHHGSWKM